MSGEIAPTLESSVQRAIAYLTTVQRPCGLIETTWSLRADLSDPKVVDSPFVTAMVLLAVSDLPNASSIRRRGLALLRRWREPDGLVRFLPGIDPDLDDTCLVNALLQTAGAPDAFDYGALANRVARRSLRGGLFETWVRTEPGAANDLDPCVSVNALRFLSVNGLAPAPTIEAVRNAAWRGTYRGGTLYYQPGLSLAYCIATLPARLRDRLLEEPVRGALLDEACSSRLETALDAALALFVRVRCGDRGQGCGRLADLLMGAEEGYGAWPATAFFRAFNYWGSAELVTAVAAQALWELRSSRAQAEG